MGSRRGQTVPSVLIYTMILLQEAFQSGCPTVSKRSTASSFHCDGVSIRKCLTKIKSLRGSFPVRGGRLILGPVQDLLELSDTMSHTRVHVRLRTLDVVVEVIAEVLDVADGRFGDGGVGEVTGEKNKCHVANILGLCKTREVAEFQGRVPGGVEDLWRALDRGQTSCVNKFLSTRVSIA